jgi:hypothetical protein
MMFRLSPKDLAARVLPFHVFTILTRSAYWLPWFSNAWQKRDDAGVHPADPPAISHSYDFWVQDRYQA